MGRGGNAGARGACGIRPVGRVPPGRRLQPPPAPPGAALKNARAARRAQVNTIQLKETQEEAQKTQEQVLVDRQHAIDAAVVRIMKMRKQLAHKLLVAEVLSQLKFSLTSSDLKRRIESLIERDFLERDAADPTLYKYLA
jgi:cullin-4